MVIVPMEFGCIGVTSIGKTSLANQSEGVCGGLDPRENPTLYNDLLVHRLANVTLVPHITSDRQSEIQ